MTVRQNTVVADTSVMAFQPGSWEEAAYDVYVGLRVGVSHAMYFGKLAVLDSIVKPTMNYMGIKVEEPQKQKQQIDDGGLKVIGVGYGRTGTYSLTMALEELGFPTLHTQHLYENDEIFSMWTHSIFQPSIDSGEAFLGEPDLELIASYGYTATMDLPMALYFDQVHQKYPDCKFILTTRENSEVWFSSWDTLTKSITQPARYGGLLVTNVNQLFIYMRWLYSIVNNDNTYLTAPFPLPNQHKEKSIASYEAHNRRVREEIPSHQLLEYKVNEGWEPLCRFLEIKECPTKPFPKSNSARSVQVQAISSMVVPLIIIFFLLFTLFTYIFQHITGKTMLQWISTKLHQTMCTLPYRTAMTLKGKKGA
mmetsp:Transcript_32180/g.45755  ORF Transcript_32180/g.45755 Transcript_32180/m.45755 type:complete len:365 (-) Transcript_32180:142-1236(-)